MASNEEILAGLAEIVNEETGLAPEAVEMDKSFTDDLDIDSISMMTIVVNAEEKFDVRIPDEEVKNLKTVGDAVSFIARRPGLATTAPATGAAGLPVWTTGPAARAFSGTRATRHSAELSTCGTLREPKPIPTDRELSHGTQSCHYRPGCHHAHRRRRAHAVGQRAQGRLRCPHPGGRLGRRVRAARPLCGPCHAPRASTS